MLYLQDCSSACASSQRMAAQLCQRKLLANASGFMLPKVRGAAVPHNYIIARSLCGIHCLYVC